MLANYLMFILMEPLFIVPISVAASVALITSERTPVSVGAGVSVRVYIAFGVKGRHR